jgi:hypothetical protein
VRVLKPPVAEALPSLAAVADRRGWPPSLKPSLAAVADCRHFAAVANRRHFSTVMSCAVAGRVNEPRRWPPSLASLTAVG